MGLGSLINECHGRWGRQRFYLGLLVLCIILGFFWFLIPGLPGGDDILFHLYRVEQLAGAFRRGEPFLPVYSEGFDGYGYAISLFYSDALLYPPALLRATGLPLVFCLKLYLLGMTIALGIFSYLCAFRMSKSCFAGFAAGLLTCWSGYYATDCFNRFALGEVLAFPGLPLALLGYYEILHGAIRRWWILALGFTEMLLAHNLSFLMAFLLFSILFLSQLRQWLSSMQRLKALFLAAVTCLLLTAFYWRPMIEQLCCQNMTLAELGLFDISHYAMPWWKLFCSLPDSWLPRDGQFWAPAGVGGVLLLLLPCLWASQLWRGPKAWSFSDSIMVLGILCCFLASDLAPWQSVLSHTHLSRLQFPWRFLVGGTCFLAIGGGVVLGRHLRGEWQRERRYLIALLVWCGAVWLINVGTEYVRGGSRHTMIECAYPLRALECGIMHYFPAGLTEEEVFKRGETVKIKGDITVTSLKRPAFGVLACQFTGGDGSLELPLAYYLGYEARLEQGGMYLPVGRSTSGLVAVTVPRGLTGGTLVVRYGGTLQQSLSRLLSLVTLMVLAAWLCYDWRRDRG